MNKDLIKSRFAKSLPTYEQQAEVQLHIAKNLAQKAKEYLPAHCENIFEIGCGTGFLTREILQHITCKQLFLNDLIDLTPQMELLRLDANTKPIFIPGDAEEIKFPINLQVLLSASSIQWLTDLPAFFSKVNAALLPEAHFICSTFGPENLSEIKKLMGEGLNYPTAENLKNLLTSNFEILEMTEELKISYFDSPRSVLLHLKDTGVTATKSGFRWTKSSLNAFENSYWTQFGCNGKVSLHWQIYYFVCRKKSLL